MKNRKNKVARLLLIFALILIVISNCISLYSTKPNKPYVGPHPAVFNDFAQENPLCAQELGKLPEIQDGISDNEAAALEIIFKLYNDDTENFNKVFEQMYRVGKPDVRKYCTALQCIFWLAEDGKVEELDQILSSYSLGNLLQKAWILDRIEREQYKGKVLELSEAQSKMIVNELGAKDPEEKIFFDRIEKSAINDVILYLYKENPSLFPKKATKTIEDSLVDLDQYKKGDINYFRWKDFDTVIERLNSPELIDYYERHRLFYSTDRILPGKGIVPPRYVFEHNTGECVSITRFTIHCLMKAGYHAYELRVPGPGLTIHPWHAVCLFKVDGKKYIMDNGRYFMLGIMPYDKYFGK
jgi:hypothetical protein